MMRCSKSSCLARTNYVKTDHLYQLEDFNSGKSDEPYFLKNDVNVCNQNIPVNEDVETIQLEPNGKLCEPGVRAIVRRTLD